MVHKARTADEKFILMAYQKAKEADDMDLVMNKFEVGTACGMAAKASETISRTLMQTNFIKKVSEVEFRLTKNGEQLALRLLGE